MKGNNALTSNFQYYYCHADTFLICVVCNVIIPSMKLWFVIVHSAWVKTHRHSTSPHSEASSHDHVHSREASVSQHRSACDLRGYFQCWFWEETSPLSFETRPWASRWIIVMPTPSAFSEGSVQGEPCLYAVSAPSSGASTGVLKDVPSNINHTSKQRWILKSSHDQGYCPQVSVQPQTTSFYKLGPRSPWDFAKWNAFYYLFQELRSLRVPLGKLQTAHTTRQTPTLCLSLRILLSEDFQMPDKQNNSLSV